MSQVPGYESCNFLEQTTIVTESIDAQVDEEEYEVGSKVLQQQTCGK